MLKWWLMLLRLGNASLTSEHKEVAFNSHIHKAGGHDQPQYISADLKNFQCGSPGGGGGGGGFANRGMSIQLAH